MELRVRFAVAIGGHDFLEDLAGGGRRPDDGVCAGGDGALQTLVRGTAGGDDGQLRELFSDGSDHLRRLRARGHVDDGGAAFHTLRDALGRDGGDDEGVQLNP